MELSKQQLIGFEQKAMGMLMHYYRSQNYTLFNRDILQKSRKSSLTANKLQISRTTLWRYLRQ